MSTIKRYGQQYLFTILMALFVLSGSAVTVQAMRVSPPENIEQVVLGNVNPRVVNTAVRTGDDTLLVVGDESDDLFGDFFDIRRRGPRRGRPEGRR